MPRKKKILDHLAILYETEAMKQLIRLTILFCACAALALTVVAGPESLPSGKEMKQVAPAPLPECNWSGFYIGLNVGGQWGHSEDKDFDYNFGVPNGFDGPKTWGYDESGVVAGGQVGYNFQWNWLVLGVEADGGFMNLDGSGVEPGSPGRDTRGHTDSDFFTTVRGRLGFAFGHWMFYATGGGIGVNLETRVTDDCAFSGACGDELIHAGKTEFNWGWTGGGGVEYMFGCHWTVKAEYLRYQLDDKSIDHRDRFADLGGLLYGISDFSSEQLRRRESR
jgi:outer membrane immunogenic protein